MDRVSDPGAGSRIAYTQHVHADRPGQLARAVAVLATRSRQECAVFR